MHPECNSPGMHRIWLIGGTSESREVADRLSVAGLPWVATVTSDRARRLYAAWSEQPVWVGRLDPVCLVPWLTQAQIGAIVDASHPFAVEISRLAIATGLPYLRYERSPVPPDPATIVLPNFAALLAPEFAPESTPESAPESTPGSAPEFAPNYLDGRRVLLTTGVKNLELVRPWLGRSHLWARILPTAASRQAAIAAGFPPDHLVPQQLPTTFAAERSLWQRLGIDTVVMKAAGAASGADLKQAVARSLGIRAIMIARPAIVYPAQTSDLGAIVPWLRRLQNGAC